MHPTLSATQKYNYTLARCLDTSLTPLSLNCYTVTDIFEFANEIRNLKIANGDILVSCLPNDRGSHELSLHKQLL